MQLTRSLVEYGVIVLQAHTIALLGGMYPVVEEKTIMRIKSTP